jgi:hypothetical protein
MQDEPTSGMDAPKPEPTVADAFAEAKEAFAAAGSVIGANVKKAVKKARTAIRKATKKKAAKKKPAKKKVAKRKAAKKSARKSKARKGAKKKTARRKAGKAKK